MYEGVVDLADVVRNGVDGDWLEAGHEGVLPATDENVEAARAFAAERWAERAREMGLPAPADMSGACKFNSLFVKAVFGGAVAGHYDHLHNVVDGRVVDLQAGAADVRALADPYRNDPDFLWDDDLAYSLGTCLPRVSAWTQGFLAEMRAAPAP